MARARAPRPACASRSSRPRGRTPSPPARPARAAARSSPTRRGPRPTRGGPARSACRGRAGCARAATAALAVPDGPERLHRHADLHDARAQHQPRRRTRRRSASACAAGRRARPACGRGRPGARRRPGRPGARAASRTRIATVYGAAVRAAAVQLNSGADVDRNLEAADRLVRAAARDGAQLVVLPEKWPALGAPDVIARRAPSAPTTRSRWARAHRARARHRPRRGLDGDRRPDGRRCATPRSTSAPTARSTREYTKIHLFDVEVDGRAYRESDARGRGRRAGR